MGTEPKRNGDETKARRTWPWLRCDVSRRMRGVWIHVRSREGWRRSSASPAGRSGPPSWRGADAKAGGRPGMPDEPHASYLRMPRRGEARDGRVDDAQPFLLATCAIVLPSTEPRCHDSPATTCVADLRTCPRLRRASSHQLACIRIHVRHEPTSWRRRKPTVGGSCLTSSSCGGRLPGSRACHVTQMTPTTLVFRRWFAPPRLGRTNEKVGRG